MKKEKLYFENEDSEICYPLSYHIENAKEEGLKEIELFEAIPDTINKDIIWCSELETTGEKSDCNKTCPYYEKPEKGHICKLRGRLMEWGVKVKFNVETSLPIIH
jgi:hypothetical protein